MGALLSRLRRKIPKSSVSIVYIYDDTVFGYSENNNIQEYPQEYNSTKSTISTLDLKYDNIYTVE